MSIYTGGMANRTELVRAWLEQPAPLACPVVRYGADCDEPRCHTIVLGATEHEAVVRLAGHRRRCHG